MSCPLTSSHWVSVVVHQRAGQAGESAGAVLPQEPPDGGEQGRHHAAVHHRQSRAAAGAQQVPGERGARPGASHTGQTRTDRRSACRAPWGAGLVFFQMIMQRACLSDGPCPGPSGGEWHLVHAEKPAIRWPDELSRASCPVPGGHRRKVGTGARRGRSSPAPCQRLGAAGGRWGLG